MHYAFGLLLISVLVDPIDHDLQYIAALRTDSFYRLSQSQGERMLTQTDLTAEQRAQVVVEISKTFAAQALNSRPPSRETFWKQAAHVLDEELRKQPDVAVRVLLQSQLAFIKEQQAEWSVREAEIRSRSDDDWVTARGQLRDAIKSLKQVRQDVASPAIRNQQSLSDARLQAVTRNIQYQLANAYLHQAIAYSTSSRDRSNALTQAMEGFQVLASGRENDELVWKSRIGRIRCVRMLGQFSQVQTLLKQLSDAPEKYIGALAAESIRLALDARSLESAMQLATNERIDASDPEFQLARIEAFVAAAEQLKGQPKAKAFQQECARTVARLANEHGVYWSLRGEILLSRLALDENADTGLLSNAAETMLRQDSPESAKQMFQRAAEQASQQGGQRGDQKAFEFLYKAAVVDHREGRLQPAIDQFRSVAEKYPQHPQAADAHLLAVFDAAALYQEYAAANASTMDKALTQYENLLSEHIHAWSDSPTADQARIWAAKLALAKRQWQAAIELYQAIPIGSKFEVEVYRALGEAFEAWFASQKASPDDVQSQRTWMQSRSQSNLPKDARRQLARVAAKLAMSHVPRDYAMAEAVLRSAPNDLQAPDELTRELGVLRVLATMGAGQAKEARRLFGQLVPLPLDSLLMLMRGLRPIRAQRPDDAELQAFTMELIGLLKPYHNRIDESDRLDINMAVADYLPPKDAAAHYEQFAKDNPRDYPIQLRYAETLSEVRNRESRRLAVQQWRRVVQLSKKQSVDWFRAKLGVATAHFEMGERKKAKELIEYLTALYPDLGGIELTAQFEQLLKRIGG